MAVLAEGAYIIKSHRQMQALSDQVQQLAADSIGQDEPAPRGEVRAWGGGRSNPLMPTAGRLPPPRFSPPSGSSDVPPSSPPGAGPALPPALDNPEAREQLRGFIASELAHEREEQRERVRLERDQEQQKRMNDMVKALGLNEADGKKLVDVMTKGQEDRRALRERCNPVSCLAAISPRR